MTTVANLLVQISADTAQLRTGLRGAETTLDRFTGRLSGIGNSIKAFGGTLGQITDPLKNMGMSALDTASNFEVLMAEISARTGIVGDDLQSISDFALQMGADTSFSASQAADAFLQLLSSGQTAEQAIATLPTVLDAAAASGEALGTTADVLTDILASFGLPIENWTPQLQEAADTFGVTSQMLEDWGNNVIEATPEIEAMAASIDLTTSELADMIWQTEDAQTVVDSLAAAAGASSADMASLGQGFANVGGVASNFGLSVNDTAATLAVLSENGIKGAEAGTALKSMLLNMVRPTEDVQAAWTSLGTSFYDAEGNARPLSDVIDDIKVGMEGMPAERQNELMQQLAGSYGIVALTALMGETSIDDMTTAMQNQSSASEVADARLNTFQGRTESLMGSIETLAINAMTPFMDSLGELAAQVTPVVNQISNWAKENPDLSRTIVSIGAALVVATPLIIAIGTAMTMAAPVVGVLGSAISLMLGPVGLLVVGLIALGRVLTDPAIQDGLSAWAGVWDNFKLIIAALPEWITAKLNEIAVSIRNGMRDANQGILEAMGTLAASGNLVGVDLGANAIAEQLAGSLQAENIESQIAGYLNGQALTIDTSGMNFLVGEGANAAPEEMVNSFLGSLTDPVALQNAINQAIGSGDAAALEVLLPLSLKTAEDPALQMQELLTTALEFGGESGVGFNVLLPIAQELDVDVASVIEQFNTSLTEATAAPFDATLTANITVVPGAVDVSAVNSAVASALPGGAAVSSGGGGGGIVPALATGGYIQSEGLAYLHAGEVVLNRDQQAAYGGGGRNVTVNVSNYGNTMFEVLEITRKAARREDF